ncbi:MAG: hypothetical protein D6724_10885 [Armatimonadetes bacterium]|nr:MAG: hypothetical protein D6724_10885 [Armatimonadota bacterium]GIV02997.1 MAG: hypothetical protein KatS3mg015_1827 [Fimbriimonadales bacterium]
MDQTLNHALEATSKQVTACLAGLAPDHWDAKPLPPIGSPREIVHHLCDAYCAVVAQAEGKEYEWGSFALPAGADPCAVWREERNKAVKALAGADAATSLGLDYIALHDAYHVGQLCAVRLALDPEWDSYSIYR